MSTIVIARALTIDAETAWRRLAQLDDVHHLVSFLRSTQVSGDRRVCHIADDAPMSGTLDEMFLVLTGSLRIEYEERVVHLRAGQAHVVPRGTLHRPVAEQECLIALIEPASTRHTGDVLTDRTRSIEEQLAP